MLQTGTLFWLVLEIRRKVLKEEIARFVRGISRIFSPVGIMLVLQDHN